MRITLGAAIILALGFSSPTEASSIHFIRPLFLEVRAFVTGYNTVPGQTDDTPCIAASGANICGRTDAVACPRRISLGTLLQIRGTIYVCEDRLATKYDARFDISCDKDTDCPNKVTGWATIRIFPGIRRPATMIAASWQPQGDAAAQDIATGGIAAAAAAAKAIAVAEMAAVP